MKRLALMLLLFVFTAVHAQPSREETIRVIQRAEALIVQLEEGMAANRARLLRRMLQSPQATLAVIATGGGVAGFLSSQLDSDTRAALVAAGVVGAAWCLDSKSNSRDCDESTSDFALNWRHLKEREEARAGVQEIIASQRKQLAAMK